MRALELHGRPADPELCDRLLRAKIDRYKEVVLRGADGAARRSPRSSAPWRERVPVAIGSGAVREEIVHVLDQHGLRDLFGVLVTIDDVEHGKPDPETYLRCLAALRERAPGLEPATAWCSRTRGSASPPRTRPACAASRSTPRASWSGLRRPIWSCKVSPRELALGLFGTEGRMTIDEVIAGVPAWAGRDVQVESIEGGLTNANYRLTVGDEQFCVRIPGRDSSLLAVDRRAEHLNTLAAAEAGVGAHVRYTVGDEPVMVLEWIDGEVQDEETLHREGAVEQIAASVRRLHAGPRFGNAFDMFRIQQRYRAICAEHGFRIPDDYDDHEPRRPPHRGGDGRPGRRPRAVQQRPPGRQLHRDARAASGSSTTSTPA